MNFKSGNNLPELKEIETLRGKMENKKQKINSKITLYEPTKFIALIALGFIIGSVLRYASMIFFEVPIWVFDEAVELGTFALIASGILSVIMFFFFYFSTSSAHDWRHPYIYYAVFIGTFTGYAIGFALTYDSTIASATDMGYIIGSFFIGFLGAMALATVDSILVYTYIHKKRIINLSHAVAIGFTFGFYFGHILVFSILGLV